MPMIKRKINVWQTIKFILLTQVEAFTKGHRLFELYDNLTLNIAKHNELVQLKSVALHLIEQM